VVNGMSSTLFVVSCIILFLFATFVLSQDIGFRPLNKCDSNYILGWDYGNS